MVKKIIAAARVLVALMMVLGPIPHVYADDIATVPTVPQLDSSPLIITSYKTANGGTDIAFVQIYNTSSSLQNLSTWTLTDGENNRSAMIEEHAEYIEPGSHVVIAQSGVQNATYTMTGWSQTIAAPKVIKSLMLSNTQFKPHISQVGGAVDAWLMRNATTTGYSTATTAAAFGPAYQPLFDDGLYAVPNAPVGLQVAEVYPYASTCDPLDSDVLCGDYVKLVNDSEVPINLSSYVLRTDSSSSTRTNANTFDLSAYGVLNPGSYVLISQTDTGGRLSLTNSGGYVWVEDTWGLAQFPGTMTHYEPAGSSLQGYGYAVDSSGNWQWTSTPTPSGENIITPPPVQGCPDGKYLNPETNRCRSLEDTLSALATCDEGSERNPTTNRCRKVTTTTSTQTPCKEGQVRNPETNRCRSIASEVADLIPCNDGYERNPATNRCRKVAVAGSETVKYPVEPYKQGSASNATWWVMGGMGTLAVGYAAWEWREEIGLAGSKLLKAFAPRRR
jgi:hypothetical protein